MMFSGRTVSSFSALQTFVTTQDSVGERKQHRGYSSLAQELCILGAGTKLKIRINLIVWLSCQLCELSLLLMILRLRSVLN